jgi:putative transcriptional regulator
MPGPAQHVGRRPAERVSITPANLAVPKNGHARAMRFATSAALREAHDCRTGDLRRSVTEE